MLTSLLPLWLLSYAIMVEGFPRPPIPLGLAIALFVFSLMIGGLLLWIRWSSTELFLYSLLPFWFLPTFDEISTTYKTPFIILGAVILSIGLLSYRFSRAPIPRWLFLVFGVIATVSLASLLANRYWQLVNVAGYAGCYPDCLPSPDQGYPWWDLIFDF